MTNYASNIILTNCVFRNNESQRGGGIFHSAYGETMPTMTLINCQFIANSARGGFGFLDTFGGGAIYSISEANSTLTNCTFSGNRSLAYRGGAIMAPGSPALEFNNCTFSGNWAKYKYGPSHTIYGNATLTNCIHRAATAGLVYDLLISGPVTYSNIQGGWLGVGNIDVDPCFAKPGCWVDVNDPNIIVEPNDPNALWLDGDYHLQSAAGRWDPDANQWAVDANTSLCIDAGNPGCDLGDEPNDANNIRINMGAHGGTAEASKSPANWALLADLTNDRKVDYNDLAAFSDYWLEVGECLPSDLSRNQSANFADFGIFALQWLQTTTTQSAISYQIGDCSSGESALSAVEQSSETRFSVTVDGRYIHFEDTMVANCCPDELELQMTAEGNLIAIHEIERVTMPCLCICEYPVTATLGPFEPGMYTLEVYQDSYYQGSLEGTYFVGSTTVTIDPAE